MFEEGGGGEEGRGGEGGEGHEGPVCVHCFYVFGVEVC